MSKEEETMTEPTPSTGTVSSEASTPPSKMLPSTSNSISSSLSENELRKLFRIVETNLDFEALLSLYDFVEQEFPDELETAHEILEGKEDGDNEISEESDSQNEEIFNQTYDQETESTNGESVKAVEKILSSLESTKGCYLHYDSASGKLKLQYTDTPVKKAIGFYSSRTIPGHKFRKNFGRADLISGCFSGLQGRKNYYNGWCQFVRAARNDIKAEQKVFGNTTGQLWMFPVGRSKGLEVDIYVYDEMADYQTIELPLGKGLQKEILDVDAVTCLPKHSAIFEEVKKMELNNWLVRANNVGSSIRFTVNSAPCDDESPTRGIPISLVDPTPKKILTDQDDNSPIPEPTHEVTDGCYLLYDSNSGKLKLKYSKTPVRNAIGFYCAGEGHKIRGFKYTKNFGRADLIGNCASGVSGRKNYYSGWCQFIRAARSLNGPVWIYPRDENSKGLDVDIYVYYKEPEVQKGSRGEQSKKLESGIKLDISEIDAIAVLPKHADFFSEIRTMDLPWWLTEANAIGSTSKFE